MKKKLLEFIIEFETNSILSALNESGLGGHMFHLYDNPDLRFNEIKEIFKKATEGTLENVQEKLDGQNVFFTYNLSDDELKFARNKSHIKNNGINATEVLDKWTNTPSVRDAYYNAHVILTKAIRTLGAKNIEKIFGPNGNVWFSAEVIFSENPNVINYDRNALVFHESGVSYDENGNPVQSDENKRKFEILQQKISDMQKSVSGSGWNIMGPVMLNLTQALNGTPYERAVTSLDNEISNYGLSDSATIRDYIAAKFAKNYLAQIDLNDKEKQELGQVFSSAAPAREKKQKITNIVPNDASEEIKQNITNLFLAKNYDKIKKDIILPIETIIHNFSIEILEGVHSAIALHPEKEVKRLKDTVKKEIETIKASGDKETIDKLQKQLQKLQGLDKITSSMEGIVFQYKGNTYKLTGTFAPINQILGMLRFNQ